MRILIILIGFLTITSHNNLWAGFSSQETSPAPEKDKFLRPLVVLIEGERMPLSSVSTEETFGESFLKTLMKGYKSAHNTLEHTLLGIVTLPYYIYTHPGEMIMMSLLSLGIFQVIEGVFSLFLGPLKPASLVETGSRLFLSFPNGLHTMSITGAPFEYSVS